MEGSPPLRWCILSTDIRIVHLSIAQDPKEVVGFRRSSQTYPWFERARCWELVLQWQCIPVCETYSGGRTLITCSARHKAVHILLTRLQRQRYHSRAHVYVQSTTEIRWKLEGTRMPIRYRTLIPVTREAGSTLSIRLQRTWRQSSTPNRLSTRYGSPRDLRTSQYRILAGNRGWMQWSQSILSFRAVHPGRGVAGSVLGILLSKKRMFSSHTTNTLY